MWQQMHNNVHWHAQLYLTVEVLITFLQEERHNPVRFFLLVLILEVVVG